MTRLFMTIFTLVSPTLAGSFVVAVLTMGLDTLQPILLAAAAGFVLALPVAWVVARRISN